MTERYQARTYHALAHDFTMAFDDRELASYFEWSLSAFPPASRRPLTEYAIHAHADGSGYAVTLDGDTELTSKTASELLRAFVHRINNRAIDSEYAIMSHAGGVERDGVGYVFPAHMESGKTTLTTGLVRAGFGYLSDEAVAFDWETGVIEPFPKPLSIDKGAWPLFPELAPLPAPGEEALPADQWQVPPDAIRPHAVGGSCRARYIVFPSYIEDAKTELEPMTRAEGLIELAKNTFEFKAHSRRSLDALTRVVREASCYRLTVGDLVDACALIAELSDD